MVTVEQIKDALKEVYDPEIPINILDLGLIYDVSHSDEGDVQIDMTLTNPNCPVGDQLRSQVRQAASRLDGVKKVDVNIVWEPPWNKEKMTFEGKLQFNLLGLG